jgi:hypothetical protein
MKRPRAQHKADSRRGEKRNRRVRRKAAMARAVITVERLARQRSHGPSISFHPEIQVKVAKLTGRQRIRWAGTGYDPRHLDRYEIIPGHAFMRDTELAKLFGDQT